MAEPKLTRHHKIPKKRDGSNGEANLKEVDELVHAAWHHLFQFKTKDGCKPMTPDEAIAHIEHISFRSLDGFRNTLPLVKRLAWRVVFGYASPREAIEIIKKEWS